MWHHVGTHRRHVQSKAFGIIDIYFFRIITIKKKYLALSGGTYFKIWSTGRSLARSASNHVKRVAGTRTTIIDLSRHTNSYDRSWQYAWSTNCSTASKRRAADRTETAHTRRHAPRSPPQCRAVQSVVPQPRRRAHCRAPPVTRRMQRPLVVQVQPLEGRTDLALPPHTPVPVPALRSTSAACVHGAPSRVSTQRSTPDAGANARSQPAL